MKKQLIKGLVRIRFAMTGKEKASNQICTISEKYLKLFQEASPVKACCSYRVPPMLGVDEDMREWSFYQILEHNTIVNRTMRLIVQSLARNEEPTGLPVVDAKKDVMPSQNPGAEQVEAFKESVDDYLEAVEGISQLRGTRRKMHPVFGMLNAHGWHCMFGLHLEVHYPQAVCVLSSTTQDS